MRIFKKGIFSLLFVFIFFLLGGGFFCWRWVAGPAAPKLKIEEEIFVVKRGEGVGSVAERLKKEGLIRSPLAFRILVAKEGLEKKIQAGDFRLNPGMTPYEIAQELTHGTLDIWVTIPEGWRAEEIAEAINFQFPDEAKQYEGYLFPDTYLIPKEATAGAIIKIFLKNFAKKFDENLRQEAERQGLTVNEVLILASIVEREAKHEEDRPIVAGILIKRWQNDWPLQADATIQYAIASVACRVSRVACEWWPRNLTKEDLQIDSPYNTYIYKELPPGPICNPGLASIRAVIDSRLTDYWYYLSDSSGQMHYATTHNEHAANIQKYLR